LNGDATFFITASKIPEVSNFVNLKQGAVDCTKALMLGGQDCCTFISMV